MSATINVPEELLYGYLPNTELCIAAVSNKAYLHKDILVPVACQHLFILLPNSRADTHPSLRKESTQSMSPRA